MEGSGVGCETGSACRIYWESIAMKIHTPVDDRWSGERRYQRLDLGAVLGEYEAFGGGFEKPQGIVADF